MTARSTRLGRNDPCYCGSGKKYKQCHLRDDELRDRDQREEDEAQASSELDPDAGHAGEWYAPSTRHIPAAERRDFRALVTKLSLTGAHLDAAGPHILSRDQRGLDEALVYATERGVPVHFESDPPPATIAGLQELIDGLYGRGVYRIRPSGVEMHGFGRCYVRQREGEPSIIGIAGTRQEALRQALASASQLEAESQGLTQSALCHVICTARTLRHLTVHALELPEWARAHLRLLLLAVVDDITRMAELPLLPEAGQSADAAVVLASLPFALALPEALDAPEAALAGMDLELGCRGLLLPHLERIREQLPWVVRAALLAEGDWDTFTGFTAWRERLETVPQMDQFLGFSDTIEVGADAASPDDDAAQEVEALIDDQVDRTARIGEPPPGPPGADADADPEEEPLAPLPPLPPLPPFPPLPLDPGVFAGLATLEQRHVERRREIAERRAAAVGQRAEAQAARDAAAEQLRRAEAGLSALDDAIRGVDADLDTLGGVKQQDRTQTIATILRQGAADLDQAATTWVERQAGVGHAGDEVRAQTLFEVTEMGSSGLLAKLPRSLRRRLEAEADAARTTLRDHYGELPDLVIPTVLVASLASPGCDLVCALPLRADPGVLTSGGARLALATAVCRGVAAILPTGHPDAILVVTAGEISFLHWILAQEGAVTPDLLDLAQLGIEDAAERSPELRRARVRVRCEVTDDVDDDALRALLAPPGAGLMTEAAVQLSLDQAADQLSLHPLEVLAWLAVLGLPCPDGILDAGFVDIVRDVVVGRSAPAGRERREEPACTRREALQHVLGYLVNAGRYYPAAAAVPSILAGLQDPGQGEGAIALLERCGLLRRAATRRGRRVGVNGARRHQVDQLLEAGTSEDPVIMEWLAGG